MLRLPRLVLSIFLVILFTSLYIFYPSSERTPRAGEVEYRSYEAGGIDSEHYRRPIRPDFDREEQGRAWEDEDEQEVCFGEDCEVGQEDVSISRTSNRVKGKVSKSGTSEDVFMGGVIMPKLGNETAKAELGRAAWRVLHLMTLRYPDDPTEDDRLALKSYMHLFSRLYPCGECATEFQKLLEQYPPQTSSRKSASLWLCHLHNQVNIRLDKPEFDCLTLDETYDCGCGPESSATSTGVKETGSSWGEARGQWREEAGGGGGGRGAAVEAGAGVGVGVGGGTRMGSELGGSKFGWKGDDQVQGENNHGGDGAGAQLGSPLGGSKFGYKGEDLIDEEEVEAETQAEEEAETQEEVEGGGVGGEDEGSRGLASGGEHQGVAGEGVAGAQLGSPLGGSRFGYKGDEVIEGRNGAGPGAQLGSPLGGSRFGYKGEDLVEGGDEDEEWERNAKDDDQGT